jgi:carbonic anhydrase
MSALPSQFGVSPYDETYLQYCGSTITVCSSGGEWFVLSQRWRMSNTGNGSFTDYAPGLSIKTDN